MHQIHAPDTCTRYMHQIHAPDTCTRYMHRYMHQIHAPDTCTRQMHQIHAPDTCTRYMNQIHAPDTCTRYMHQIHHQIFESAISDCTARILHHVRHFGIGMVCSREVKVTATMCWHFLKPELLQGRSYCIKCESFSSHIWR